MTVLLTKKERWDSAITRYVGEGKFSNTSTNLFHAYA